MSDAPPEPQSMEDILASIKRVISADAAAARRLPTPAPPPPAPPVTAPSLPADAEDDEVLELGEPLLSPRAEQASRAALASLQGMTLDPAAPANTLDGLVREMLRPMVKAWLDEHLPELVERIVAREVARIVGR